MPELLQILMAREWVVIATERAKRPDQRAVKREAKSAVSFSEKCPFCLGHESPTPPEILGLPDGDEWKARLIPNKFAALSPECLPERTIDVRAGPWADSASTMSIVETPDQSPAMAQITDSEVADILRIDEIRYDQLGPRSPQRARNDPR